MCAARSYSLLSYLKNKTLELSKKGKQMINLKVQHFGPLVVNANFIIIHLSSIFLLYAARKNLKFSHTSLSIHLVRFDTI